MLTWLEDYRPENLTSGVPFCCIESLFEVQNSRILHPDIKKYTKTQVEESIHFYLVLAIFAWLRVDSWSSRIYAFLRGSRRFCASEDDLE